MESIEDIGFRGLKLVQSREGFRFGIDAVLLADFAGRFCPDAGSIVDLGTGNGVVPFILSRKLSRADYSITGIDVQREAVDLAQKGCSINALEDRIRFVQCDVADLQDSMPGLQGTADVVVSNPPYVVRGGGIINDRDSRYLSRQETTAGIEEFIRAAGFLLKNRGHLFLVHRPSRLVDIFYHCRNQRLEPKDIRFVTPRRGEKPNIVLIHCIKGGGHQLDFLESLIVYGDDGDYTPEIMKIYEKTG